MEEQKLHWFLIGYVVTANEVHVSGHLTIGFSGEKPNSFNQADIKEFQSRARSYVMERSQVEFKLSEVMVVGISYLGEMTDSEFKKAESHFKIKV